MGCRPEIDLVVGLADAPEQARLPFGQVGDLGDEAGVEVVAGPDASSGVGAVPPVRGPTFVWETIERLPLNQHGSV
jgi:hypothetical protein